MPNSSSRPPLLTIRAEGTFLPVGIFQRIVENAYDLDKLSLGKLKGVQTHVEPNLPPDVLGIYVYLPKI